MLVIITTTILFVSLFLFLGVFLGTLSNYRKLRKRIQYDQERSEKGEAVLLKDSFLNDLFYYADKDFSLAAPPADPIGVYSALIATKWIFTLSQVILIVTLVGIGIALFKSLTGSDDESNSEGAFKQFMRMAFPMIMSIILAMMMIFYLKSIYIKQYTNQIWPQIIENQKKLNELHTLILGSLAVPGDTEFYQKIATDNATLDEIHSQISPNSSDNNNIRRIVTLSIRDYFMAEVPSYTTSPIRNLFVVDSSKQMTTPGLYIRIDCSRTVQNYAYKYEKILKGFTDLKKRAEILAGVSDKINEINKKISAVRLESQPMITLIENFFRISTYYFFFMVIIVLAIIIGWYNLGCRINRVWLLVKYFFLKLKTRILPVKKDKDGNPIVNKEALIQELEQEYERKVAALECVKTKPVGGGDGSGENGEKPKGLLGGLADLAKDAVEAAQKPAEETPPAASGAKTPATQGAEVKPVTGVFGALTGAAQRAFRKSPTGTPQAPVAAPKPPTTPAPKPPGNT